MMKQQYSLQLYSVRDITKDDFKGAIEKVAKIGYDAVEPAGFFGVSAEDVKARGMSLGQGEAPVADIRRKAIALGVTMTVESEGLNPDGISEVTRCIDYLRQLDSED